MKYFKRILFFLSFFVLYVIAKEFLQLYTMLHTLHPFVAYFFSFLVLTAFIYFVAIPIFRILSMPAGYGPVYDPSQESRLIAKRIKRFKKNKHLIRQGFDVTSLTEDRESYDRVIAEMKQATEQQRRKDIPQLFYATAIVQNGFLDALLILSAAINHIKEIFILYNGRVSNRDLMVILKKIYYAMAIGGSEAAEYATEEVFSRFATDGMKSIPFVSKVSSSLVDGYINAVMLTRISYITENFCKKTVVASDKDLLPSSEFIFASAKTITEDIRDKIYRALKKRAKSRIAKALSPVTEMFHRTMDFLSPEEIDPENQYALEIPSGGLEPPISYGLWKLFESLRKR
ncbi:hypothetical protein GX408_20620 [bacterium]|nr:hypothetical protein [bacterium]